VVFVEGGLGDYVEVIAARRIERNDPHINPGSRNVGEGYPERRLLRHHLFRTPLVHLQNDGPGIVSRPRSNRHFRPRHIVRTLVDTRSHREARIIRCLRDTPRLVGKHTPRILIRRDGNHPRPSGRLEDERFGRLDGEGRRSRLWLLLPASSHEDRRHQQECRKE